MRAFLFIGTMAFLGFAGGNFVGFSLSGKGIGEAMCLYYPHWEFCKEENRQVLKESYESVRRAIAGISMKVSELERKVDSLKHVFSASGEELCVKAYTLNVRLYPGEGRVIKVYKKGDRVNVRERVWKWIRTEDGWVHGSYLGMCDEGKGARNKGQDSSGS